MLAYLKCSNQKVRDLKKRNAAHGTIKLWVGAVLHLPLLTYQAESWQFVVIIKASLDMVDLELVAESTDVHITENRIDGLVVTFAIRILWHQAGRLGM